MNVILNMPIAVRLAVAFVLGACVGSLVNLAAYRLAWRTRAISPWLAADGRAPPRRAWDRVPILGWLGLRREAPLHGPGFWIRPMLVELGLGLGFAAIYWWETVAAGLLPAGFPPGGLVPFFLHCEVLAHLLLLSLMLAASLIDVDEKTIPDAITLPGTLLGLVLATAIPWSLLPNAHITRSGYPVVDFLRLTSPNPWPPQLDGFPSGFSLFVALGCFLGWCAAILPRTWYNRHGWRRAMRLSLARLVRSWETYAIGAIAAVGSAAIVAVWRLHWVGLLAARDGVDISPYEVVAANSHWGGLLTALVGMAGGAGLIWLARIFGSAALGREAMGFGDVTLMGMIGAFLGWQTCPIIFFLAPLAGLVLGVVQLILRRGSEIPYGPFLCLAALGTIIFWAPIWGWAMPALSLGWLVPLAMLACLLLMGVLLAAWKAVRTAIFG